MLKNLNFLGVRYLCSVARMTFQPVVISGPSGSGKSTMIEKLMADYKNCFAFSVSHTTRKPRPGEVDGKDYNFVERPAMEEAVANSEFIETAEFAGNLYGTSKKAVADVVESGRICILDIEMQGVKSVKKTDLKPRFIFVKPPSMQALEERLRARGTETEESLEKRLNTAREALAFAAERGAYDHIIENDDLEVAYSKLKGILIKDIETLLSGKS